MAREDVDEAWRASVDDYVDELMREAPRPSEGQLSRIAGLFAPALAPLRSSDTRAPRRRAA